ncbi:hypothetical protein [Ruegeria atlantica]|uniref:Secreted protein n=1 Tax=Ruegeria atlantica TaxID=81569 RepID=A0ABX1WER2_9RHOB|nr:hypothetical protein [Ruegeria atlantica]NOD31791.1 hypothetical protein [Ruegeria atlantica]
MTTSIIRMHVHPMVRVLAILRLVEMCMPCLFYPAPAVFFRTSGIRHEQGSVLGGKRVWFCQQVGDFHRAQDCTLTEVHSAAMMDAGDGPEGADLV